MFLTLAQKKVSGNFSLPSYCSYAFQNFDTKSVDISFHKTGHNFKMGANFKIAQHSFGKEVSYHINTNFQPNWLKNAAKQT